VAALVGLGTSWLLGRASPAATLVSNGKCGSCVYDLDQVSPDTSGEVACPECGAVWKAYRLRQRPRDMPLRGDAEAEFPDADDRGVLTSIIAAPRAASRPSSSTEVIDAAAALGASAKRLRRWVFGVAFVVLLINIPTLAIVNRSTGLIGPILIMAVGGVVLRMALGVAAPAGARRRALLGVGLCPACLGDISGLPAEEDACVICRTCCSAWRHSDIGPRPKRCRRCGYDLAGIGDGPCPECGRSRVRGVPDLRPPGQPCCARCGGDMEGRESRACEACGAMYGLVFKQ
jgi:hypothetical protein